MTPRRSSRFFIVCVSALAILTIAMWVTGSEIWRVAPVPGPATHGLERSAPQLQESTPLVQQPTREFRGPAPRLQRTASGVGRFTGQRPTSSGVVGARPPAPTVSPSSQPGDGSARDAEYSVVATGRGTVVTPAADVNRVQLFEICRPGDGGAFSAADAIQKCIDRAPAFSSVDILPGTYILQKQLVVSTPLTIRTAGSAHGTLSCVHDPNRCAVLTAGPDLLDEFGMLLVASTNNVTLEHVVLDGNRSARLSSVAARWCPDLDNTVGFNAAVLSCLSCGLDDVVSRNALCGSGMVWSGARALIQRSAFISNGDATTPGMWADGLTVIYAPESEIHQNQFVDNSDVGLIIGYGARSRVEQNIIVQRAQSAFAGLMLHNFYSGDLGARGDFRDAVIADNIVDCGAQQCVFGIQVGPRPWDPTTNIIGGDLHGNTVRGAKIGINVDGAGTVGAPIRIFGNVVSDVPAESYFSGCAQEFPTDWMNVSPTSVVDRHDELLTTGEHLSDRCELSSALAPDAP